MLWNVVARTGAAAALAVLVLAAPAAAAPFAAGHEDPLETTYGPPDIGAIALTVGDDDVVTVRTQLVPRPPADWGNCVPFPGGFGCVPVDMTVRWFFVDGDPATGSLADGEGRVTAIPSRGSTTMEAARFDRAAGRWIVGPVPQATREGDALTWSSRLSDLGVVRGVAQELRVVATYKTFTGLGNELVYEDRTEGFAFTIPAPPAPGGGAGGGAAPPRRRATSACRTAARLANRLQKRIRAQQRRLRSRSARVRRSARAAIRSLTRDRREVVKIIREDCAPPRGSRAPRAGGQPPPPAANPRCRLVTKPVLVQRGTGISAPWVFENRVVTECG